MMTKEETINQYRADFNALGVMMVNNMPKRADHVVGNFSVGICPSLQFIGWEALKNEDIPYHIKENGIYIIFEIDFATKSVEVFQSALINLCRDEQKATYLAMTSMKNLAKGRGLSWFRKQKFKDINDLYRRLRKFYDNMMDVVNEYTGGYPYKQGIGWVDPSKNEKIA